MPWRRLFIRFFKVKRTYEHILAIVTGFTALSWYTGRHWMMAVAVLVGLSALLFPAVADRIARVWTVLAEVLGRVVPVLLLSLLFFLLLLPLALLSRWGGKDPLLLKKPAGSAFKDRNKSFTPADFHKPW